VVEKTRAVDLAEFDEAYAGKGVVFEVWLTPSQAHIEAWKETRDWLVDASERARKARAAIEDEERRAEYDTATAERLQREYDRRLDAWLAETWRNWEVADVETLHAHLTANCPAMWDWLVHQTHSAIGEFRRKAAGN